MLACAAMAFTLALDGALATLRPWRLEDLDAFHRIWGDPEVIFWGANADRAASERQLRELLESDSKLPDGQGWTAIAEKATGEIVGSALLKPAPFYPGELEVGFHLARSAWGRGLATDAVRTLVDHARRTLRLKRLVAAALPGNARSLKVLERTGFKRWGTTLHAGRSHGLYALNL